MTATCVTAGAASWSSWSHLPPTEKSTKSKPVMLPPGRARFVTNPWPTGSVTDTNTMGMVVVFCRRAATAGGDGGRRVREDHVGFERDQLRRISLEALAIAGGPAIVNRGSGPVSPSKFSQPLGEGLLEGLPLRIGCREPHQHANASHPLDWLRPRRDRQRRRTAEQRDELAAADHSITSSAVASSIGGTSRPSDRAVLRLMTSSNLTGACTGRSPGFSPLRMRST